MYDYAGNPLYNPMINPYMQQARQIPVQRQEVVKVNGENGARAYQLGANSSALLLDESGVIVWLVTTDGAGYRTVMPFDITPHEAPQPIDYSGLEARISKLEEMMQNGTTSGNLADATERTSYSDAAGAKNQADGRHDQKRR